VLSEFADEVTERKPLELAEELIKKFNHVPLAAQALLLTAVLKLRMHAMNDIALRSRAHAFFKEHARSPHVELQQRASEYLAMSELGESSIVMRETVLAPMPDWPEQGLVVVAGEDEDGGSESSHAAVGATVTGATHSGVSAVGTLAAGSAEVDGQDEGSSQPQVGGSAGSSADSKNGDDGDDGSHSTPRLTRVDGKPLAELHSQNLLDLSSPAEPKQGSAAAALATANVLSQTRDVEATASERPPPASPKDAPSLSTSGNMERMLYSGKGVLLDNMVQVGLVAKAAGAAQALTLYCGNKSNTVPIDSFAMSFQPHPSFHTVCSAHSHILLPQQQLVVNATATLLPAAAAGLSSPTPKAPATVLVSYSAAGKVHRHTVTLPLALPVFARPHNALTSQWFFSAWAAAAANATTRSVILTRLPAQITTGAALAAHMGQLGFWDGGVQLDPTSALNYAGAAMAVASDVLARVEVNPADTAQVNITVVVTRPVPKLAETFRDWLQAGLSFLCRPT
jgi:hypothetical protein